jgi:transposase
MTDNQQAVLEHANGGEAGTADNLSRARPTRDSREMERRRRKGMRMLARGLKQADVARELNVSRQTVSSWAKKLVDGPEAWRGRPLGRRSGLTDAQKNKLRRLLLAGAVANGFPNDVWTLARVAQIIEREYGLSYSAVNVWRILRKMGYRNAV